MGCGDLIVRQTIENVTATQQLTITNLTDNTEFLIEVYALNTRDLSNPESLTPKTKVSCELSCTDTYACWLSYPSIDWQL